MGENGVMSHPVYPDPHRPLAAPTGEDRSVAMIAHLSAIAAAILSAGWLSFVGPLVVWAIYKDRSPYARKAAAGAFNFNLVVWLLIIAGWVMFFTVILIPVSIVVWVVAFAAALLFHVRGALRANRGEDYTYPWQVRVLS